MPYIYVFKLTTAFSTDQVSAGAQEVFELHTKSKLGLPQRVRYRRGWLSCYPTVMTFANDAVVEDDGRAIRIDEHLEVILVHSLFPWNKGFSISSKNYTEKFVHYRRLRMSLKNFAEWTWWPEEENESKSP